MNTKNWESSPACTKYLADNKMKWEDLPVHFFQKYMKIVTQYNFHVDGWEEVWEYEKTGLIVIYANATIYDFFVESRFLRF